jgi:hypothetical protein
VKVEDSTLAVARALERMGVRYYVCGSLASSLHGDPRATNDADFVAVLRPDQAERLQKELGQRFFVDPEVFKRAVETERSFNLIDEVELAKVDIFCASDAGYQAAALQRVVTLELEPEDPFSRVTVASAEDTIVAKLRWYRMGGEVSDRQWRDLEGVVRAQAGRLDLDYVRKWSVHFRVEDLLERLLGKTGA